MGSDKTAEEAKLQYVEKMGEELGPLFNDLREQVAYLYLKWDEYVELFGAKPSRIKLLNKAAPRFFWIVQKSLWEDIILHIARLTDHCKTSGKANITIKRLVSLVDDQLEPHVSERVKTAEQKVKLCRDYRNKLLAHRDLKLALRPKAKPLKDASREEVREALESLAAVLNSISEHYMNTTISFRVIKKPGSARGLLCVLDDGVRAEDEKQKRKREGSYSEAYLKPRDL